MKKILVWKNGDRQTIHDWKIDGGETMVLVDDDLGRLGWFAISEIGHPRIVEEESGECKTRTICAATPFPETLSHLFHNGFCRYCEMVETVL